MTVGSCCKTGSERISTSDCRPSFRGMFRSSSNRSGSGPGPSSPSNSAISSTPSETNRNWQSSQVSSKASCSISWSSGSSSAIRITGGRLSLVISGRSLTAAQADTEGGAGAGLAVQADRCSVAIQDFLHNRHADSGTRVAFFLVQPLERVEQFFRIAFVEVDAVVADHQGPGIVPDVLGPHLNHRWTVGSVELDGVTEQVLQHLPQLHGVAPGCRQCFGVYLALGPADAGFHIHQHFAEDFVGVAGHHGLGPGGYSRIGQQVFNQRLHAPGS